MLDYQKVIFVTKGDNSRGPLAAAVLKNALETNEAECISRGLVVLFPEPVNAKTVAVAASKGIDLSGYASTQLESSDFGKDVLVLVLDESIKQKVYNDYSQAVNVYTLKEFVNETGSITDPYGGELADYGKLYDELDQIMRKLVLKLRFNI